MRNRHTAPKLQAHTSDLLTGRLGMSGRRVVVCSCALFGWWVGASSGKVGNGPVRVKLEFFLGTQRFCRVSSCVTQVSLLTLHDVQVNQETFSLNILDHKVRHCLIKMR